MYIYCETCGIGLHSNVASCPRCGGPGRAAHGAPALRRMPRWLGHSESRAPLDLEEVESQVRESIYGWRTGTVALLGGAGG